MPRPGSIFREIGGDLIPTPYGDIQIQILESGFEEAELELAQIALELEDRAGPLIASARILADGTQRMFDTETDPDGEPWTPLDEEYLENKISLGYPEDILHRTGALEKAATNIDAFIVTEDAMFLDVSGLPEYGLLHQTGSGSENAGLAARHRAAAKNEPGYAKREGGAHSNTGIGTGNALPARPFIGMSEETEGSLLTLFDLWFEKATHTAEGGEQFGAGIAIHPTTGIVQQRIGGKFGPKIIL